MKKIFLNLLVLTTAFTISATAQNTTQQGKKPSAFNHKQWHHKNNLMSQLNLTEDQKKQLKANNESFKKQMEELNKNESITVKEFRDKKYELKKQKKQKFMDLLTADQKTKLQQIKQQKEQERQAMADKKLDKMKITLGLTDDQVSQIKQQRKNIHDQLKAIKDNDNLSRTEKKQQLEALKKDNKDSFKKILTPDQLNKMEDMRKAKGQGGKNWESEDKNPT